MSSNLVFVTDSWSNLVSSAIDHNAVAFNSDADLDDFFEGNTSTGLSYAGAYTISTWVTDTSISGFALKFHGTSRYVRIVSCTFSSTEITSNPTAIEILECENIYVEYCYFDNNTSAVSVMSSHNITINNCNIYNSKQSGIYLSSSINCKLESNSIITSVEYGIHLIGSDYNRLFGNGISGAHDYAIYLDDSDNNTINVNSISVPTGAQGCICEYLCKNNVFMNNGDCEIDIMTFPPWAYIPIGISVGVFTLVQVVLYRKRSKLARIARAKALKEAKVSWDENKILSLIGALKEIDHNPISNYSPKSLGNRKCWATEIDVRTFSAFTKKLEELGIPYNFESVNLSRVVYFKDLTYNRLRPVANKVRYSNISRSNK